MRSVNGSLKNGSPALSDEDVEWSKTSVEEPGIKATLTELARTVALRHGGKVNAEVSYNEAADGTQKFSAVVEVLPEQE